ncbi:MAG: restriction endonuclease subunit S, partial [Candidatus Riflebacteria bacterium]|nr:restriction endonuclease subunit S [Candidatus Riflebacteria bacterium]
RGYFAYNPSRINVGSVDCQNCQDLVIVSPLYVVFKTKENLLSKYLLYYLKSNIALQLIKEKSFGSVRDNLKYKVLSEFQINLPSYEKQQEIANILTRIDSLISLRNQQLEQLDLLIKSRFVEMFGDLANPECIWEKRQIIDCCKNNDDIKCGPFGTQLNKNEYTTSGVAVWEIVQINSNFSELPNHYVSKQKAEQLEAYSIIAGDIAMSRKGNVGKCAVFPNNLDKGIIHSDVLRIRFNFTICNSIFMLYQLHLSNYILHQIEVVSSGSIMAGINVTKLKGIEIHLPPLDLQTQFAAFVEEVERSKSTIKQSLTWLNTLKSKLMQDYFG